MYQLDTEAARGAESTGTRIAERGKFKGKFTRAQHVVTKDKGTQGIDFDFQADDGRRARFTIYTLNGNGEQIYGFKQLMAIMTCLGLRGLADPKRIPAKVYDFDLKQEVEKTVEQFAELLGKPIGMLFVMEEYQPGKFRPVMAGAFQASSELVASEILDRKTTPAKLSQMVQGLRDKPYKGASSGGSIEDGSRTAAEAGAPYDDIPF